MLREAHQCSTADSPKEITFSDSDIETKVVLDLFLRLISRPATTLDDEDDLLVYTHLVMFLRKYDCQQMTQTLSLCLFKELTRTELSPIEVFAAGAILDDSELCSAAVRRAAEQRDSDADIDLTEIPAAAIPYVPQEYLCAAANATPCSCAGLSSSESADAFESSLKEIKSSIKSARQKRRRTAEQTDPEASKKKKEE